jgi:hypothetical protein
MIVFINNAGPTTNAVITAKMLLINPPMNGIKLAGAAKIQLIMH